MTTYFMSFPISLKKWGKLKSNNLIIDYELTFWQDLQQYKAFLQREQFFKSVTLEQEVL